MPIYCVTAYIFLTFDLALLPEDNCQESLSEEHRGYSALDL